MSKIINGNKIADGIIRKAKARIKKENLNLKISVILLGNNPASLSYISKKEKYANKAGVGFCLYRFSKNIKEEILIKKIKDISKSSSGIIVQLPLPFNFKSQKILNAIPEKKDIDLLSENSLGRFYGENFLILPPVVGAVKYILDKNKISVKGKNISIIGFGKLVGKPLSFWLSSLEATVFIANKSTKDFSFFTKKSDIIISGVGKPKLIKGSKVKKDVIAIDVG